MHEETHSTPFKPVFTPVKNSRILAKKDSDLSPFQKEIKYYALKNFKEIKRYTTLKEIVGDAAKGSIDASFLNLADKKSLQQVLDNQEFLEDDIVLKEDSELSEEEMQRKYNILEKYSNGEAKVFKPLEEWDFYDPGAVPFN